MKRPASLLPGFVKGKGDQRYPQVRNNYGVHLWNTVKQNNGMLLSSDKGIAEYLSGDIAAALRLMTGQRSFSEIAAEFADSTGMNSADAEAAIDSIAEQFVSEGVVEVSLSPFAPRQFSKPLTSPYQLSILQLQLTNKCNMFCAHCYAGSGKPMPHEMPTNLVFKLIDEFVDLGGCRLFLTGGEALLYKDLDDVIGYAKSRHLFVYLSTNGFLITEERVKELIKLGVGSVNVSIDGDNDETHDKFRGRKGSFKNAVDALRLFSENGIPCASQTTLYKGNLTQSENIYRDMHCIGVQSCFFVRMMPQGRGKVNAELIPTMEEYRTARENEYRNRRLQYGADVYPDGLKKNKFPNRCSAGTAQLYVRADGKCYPCPSLEIDELCFGDYTKKSLEEIWSNNCTGVNALRLFEPMNMPECKGCEHQEICRGGCAGNAYHVTGDWHNADPHFCVTMDIRKRVQQIIPPAIDR